MTAMWGTEQVPEAFSGGRPGQSCLIAGPRVDFHLCFRHHDRCSGWTVCTHYLHRAILCWAQPLWGNKAALQKFPLFLHSWEEGGILFSICGQRALTAFPGVLRQVRGCSFLAAGYSLPWLPALVDVVEVGTPLGSRVHGADLRDTSGNLGSQLQIFPE